jgi:hypothetical protein
MRCRRCGNATDLCGDGLRPGNVGLGLARGVDAWGDFKACPVAGVGVDPEDFYLVSPHPEQISVDDDELVGLVNDLNLLGGGLGF